MTDTDSDGKKGDHTGDGLASVEGTVSEDFESDLLDVGQTWNLLRFTSNLLRLSPCPTLPHSNPRSL